MSMVGIVKVCKAHVQGTEDRLDYSYDFGPEIPQGQTIANWWIWAEPNDGSIKVVNEGEEDGVLSCQVEGVLQAKRYNLWFRIELANGNIITALPQAIGGQKREHSP